MIQNIVKIVCNQTSETFCFLFQPIVLNCGHVFCKMCIKGWEKHKKTCPYCRKTIQTRARIHTMESVVNRSVKLMSAEMQAQRLKLIKERSEDNKRGKILLVSFSSFVECCYIIKALKSFYSNLDQSVIWKLGEVGQWPI